MHLDVTTLRISGALIGALVSLLALLLWLTGRMYPGFGRWTLAKALAAVATLLTLGWSQPGWLTAILGAIFAICAVTLSLQACREFLGLRPANRWMYGFVGLFGVLGILQFPLGSASDINTQSLIGGGIVYGWTALTLLQARPPGYKVGRITTTAVFLFLGVAYLANGMSQAVTGQSIVAADQFSVANSLGSIALNFAFFLMHYERQIYKRDEELARTECTNRELADLKNSLEGAVKQKTAQLVQAQRMDSIGRLAAGLAHDFNNLLTMIGGSARLLLRKLPDPSPLRRYGEEITSACEKAQTLTRRLLAFGRRESHPSSAVELNAVLQEIELILRQMIGSGTELVMALSPEPVWARIDRGEMHQVILNLVLNARDAMPKGGKIAFGLASTNAIPAGADTPPLSGTGPYVVLSVTDTGIGMDVETQGRIFEPFFTTKAPGKGTGLGLSTVYGLVTSSGGFVRVESKPAQGTVFRIYLPRAEPEAAPLTRSGRGLSFETMTPRNVL